MAGYNGRLPVLTGNRSADSSCESELANQFQSMTVGGSPTESSQGGQVVRKHQLVVGKLSHRGTTYDELTHLRNTELIEMRPGLDVSIVFVLVARESVTYCKKLVKTFEISDYDDQTPRFTLSQAPQLPVLVAACTEGSIGTVDYDDGSGYDFHIEYHALNALGSGIARYDCIQSGNIISKIFVHAGQMNFCFSARIAPELKALIISYGINRAFSAHNNDVVNTKLPQQVYETSLHRLYEGVLTQLEYGILRQASRSETRPGFSSILMDTKSDNKFLMLVNYDELLDSVEAVDVENKQLFRNNSLTNIFAQIQVTCDNQIIGRKEAHKEGQKFLLRTIDGNQLSVQQARNINHIKYVFLDSANREVGAVSNMEIRDPTPITVKVMMRQDMPTNLKRLILAFAALYAYRICKPNRNILAKAIVSSSKQLGMTTYTSGVCYSPMIRAPPSPEITPLAAMSTGAMFIIRAAGYNKASGNQFYDVIDYGTEDLLITIECCKYAQTSLNGQLIARNNKGVSIFTSLDFLADDQLTVYLPNGVLAGYHTNNVFYDGANRPIMVMTATQSKTNSSVNRAYCWGPRWRFQFTDSNNNRNEATLLSYDCSLTLDATTLYAFTETHKALMLVMAMRLNYKVYKFDQRPVPAIEYIYRR